MSELRQRQPRERDNKHLDYIRSLPCCICGDDTATEAAHIRTGSLENGKLHTGMAEKPSDRWAVPLCGKHHREQHAFGNELEWWKCHGINPFILAMTLRAPRS
jgi:hypothetical protein